MIRTLTLVLGVTCALPGIELSAADQRPLWALHASGPEETGKRKSPGSKDEKRKPPGTQEKKRQRPVNLSRCLDSCAAGGAVFIDFCNDIENPATRAVCFSKAQGSEQQCRGFCSNYFGR